MLFCALHTFAQGSLSGSLQHSLYTYVYQINAREAASLSTSHLAKVADKHLHTLTDSFPTHGPVPALPPGNYLFVHASNNKLVYRLYTPDDLHIKLVNNDHDLAVLVHAKDGKHVNDAAVRYNNKRLPYNTSTQTYGPVRNQNPGSINISHKNVYYRFPLAKNKWKQPFLRKLGNSFPLKYITSAIRRLKGNNRNYYEYFDQSTPYEQQFKGFMVFSKPRYKPRDTVQLKAFVETNKGKLVNQPLILRLTDSYLDKDTILTTLQPYRAGGYTYQFVLSDSLDLDLDDKYLLTLEEARSRKYDLDEYDGDLDDDEYAMQRKVVMRGKFEYEEYELAAVTFTARSSQEEHSRGEQLSIFLKATDDNEMAVMDGRVSIVIRPSDYSSRTFHASHVFLPDTLWSHQQALDAIGETKVNIPDSIFPKATFNYEILCSFLNSNNELQTETLFQTYAYDTRSISFERIKDSLRIAHRVSGSIVPREGTLYTFGAGKDTIATQRVTLPTVTRINPFAASYTISTDSLTEDYDLRSAKPAIACVGTRTKDSVRIQLINPDHQPVWYTIFAGNKAVLRGYGDSLFYRERATKPGNYSVSVQYIFGNQVHKENYNIPYQDKLLSIRTDQPSFVYPGQTARINIHVTDYRGEDVPGADVTAFSYTSKFQAPSPVVPYLGKAYPWRKWHAAPSLLQKENAERSIALNWERWSREMQLDTAEYYRFLHPQGIYINREPARDGISQFAPFVVDRGDIQPVHLIYIDELPVFFSQSRHMQRYSFRISSGLHTVRLRTRNKMITLDSVRIESGMKTFLSIDPNIITKHVEIKKMPDELTKYEMELWGRYMLVVVNDFGENLAYVQQYPNVFLLNKNPSGYPLPVLTGPFTLNTAELVVKNKFNQAFETEGSWTYTISKGLVKQKQYRDPYPFQRWLSAQTPDYNFQDFVLTEKEIDSLWQDYLDNRSSNTSLFKNESLQRTGNGRLQIGIRQERSNAPPFIKNIILFRHDDTDLIHVYPGSNRDLGYLQPGKYRLLFLLKNDHYFIKDSIVILPGGINYYEAGDAIIKEKDSISSAIARIIENRDLNSLYSGSSTDLTRIKERFNEKYLDAGTFSCTISGTVTDKNGVPLAGVTIMVKGTQQGTTTDARGSFNLRAPAHGTIVIASIGYSSQERKITSGAYYDIKLEESKQALEEVVVTGYGQTRKANLTGSLRGVVAGAAVMQSVSANPQSPLVIVDGLPYSGLLEDLDPGMIADKSVLKQETATAIYGSRGASGVIIITTKNKPSNTGNELPMAGNSLRRNFRDNGYWQPQLVTDANGKTSFTVTFPDDITNWQTFVIAMTGNKQSGFLESGIRSFKALSGNISLPQFAITGDTMQVIGKTLNYLSDSIQVKRTFSINDNPVKQNTLSLRNTSIDTFTVVAANSDSLKLRYTIEKANGYFDGEERTIPVFRQGVLATTGIFAALDRDTTFTLQLPRDSSAIKIYAASSPLPALYDEAEKIRNYEYLCNEQLASKLKAALVQKRIDQFLKRPFKGEQGIRELIRKLGQSRSASGLWGWWTGNAPSMWISLHVMEALAAAEQSGYTIPVNKAPLSDYLVFSLESYKGTEKLSALYLLHQLGAKADYERYVDSIERQLPDMSLYEELRLTAFKQQIGLPIALDSLIALQHHTVFGNTYWGEAGYIFFNNDIQNTLLMYRILRKAGGHDALLRKTRNYFLEKRKDGQWRNTYESSLILETILPELMEDGKPLQPASLTIGGAAPLKVDRFPFQTEIKEQAGVTISKQGNMPVYFTAYRQYWDEKPEKVSGNFIVNAHFEEHSTTVPLLKAGTPVVLKVEVIVKANADYVMVEIPIPAGCSYQDKSQSYANNEVHREYFKNKVSIFCNSLAKGKYEFTVSLLPRYTGVYTLNPARAEMMYFPVFNGREGFRKVTIK